MKLWRKPWLARMTDALQRRLGPGLPTAFGVGAMVGAGILVPVETVVGQAGGLALLAIVLAGLASAVSVVVPTAAPFRVAARLPRAGLSRTAHAALAADLVASRIGESA